MEFSARVNKIAIVIPYFGIKPKWIDYFLLSCSKNPEIDWLFFSDCLKVANQPNNVYNENFTLDDFNLLATSKLGFEISIKHPYKLCDLKPAYGIIFSDYLMEYEYWGYGDLDLVYGKIMNFFSNNDFGKYDILSNHTDFIPGHLCFMRNKEITNRLFTQIGQYKKVFQSQKYIGFDEVLNQVKVGSVPFLFHFSKWLRVYSIRFEKLTIRILKKNMLFQLLNKYRFRNIGNKSASAYDFSSIVKKESENGTIKVKYQITYNCEFTHLLNRVKNWAVKWDRGKLFNMANGKEIMYFHFMLSKDKNTFKIEMLDNLNNDEFLITKKGIQLL